MCGVGDGECRVQVIQERKPRPMLAMSAHGRAGGVRGRQGVQMESTSLEGRGRARRRLAEAQDADEGEMVTQVMPGGGRSWPGGARGSRESRRGTSAASERDSTAQPDSQRPFQGSASRGLGHTASSHQTGSESQPLKRPIRTVASRIVSVMGAECGLDPRQSRCLRSVTGWRSLRM